MKKVIISLFSILLSVSILVTSQSIVIFAHEYVLMLEYDDCEPPKDEDGEVIANCDGEEEIWYYNKRPVIDFSGIVIDGEYHLDNEVQTIKYYFEPTSFLSSYTWTTDIYKEYINKEMSHEDAMEQAELMAEEIKEAYANSLKKLKTFRKKIGIII